MHIECITNHLKEALSIVSRTTDSRGVLPILSHILVKAEDGKITLSATNLEIGVVVSIRGQIKKPGSVAIPSKLISEYIQTVQQESIELVISGEFDLELKTQGSDIQIKGVDPQEFPLIPKEKEDKWLEAPMGNISHSLSQALFATSKDISRPELSGVYFLINEKNTVAVATDGHRLVESFFKPIAADENISCIIPGKTVAEIVRIFSKKEGNMQLQIGNGQIFFNLPGTDGVSIKFTSKLIDGAYPDYKQIIPENFEVEVELNKKELIAAIKGVSLFSSLETREVKMEYQEQAKEIRVLSESSISGKGDVHIKTTPTKGNIGISFNFGYILEGLQSIESDVVKIAFSGSDGPALITGSSEDMRYLVMPLDLS